MVKAGVSSRVSGFAQSSIEIHQPWRFRSQFYGSSAPRCIPSLTRCWLRVASSTSCWDIGYTWVGWQKIGGIGAEWCGVVKKYGRSDTDIYIYIYIYIYLFLSLSLYVHMSTQIDTHTVSTRTHIHNIQCRWTLTLHFYCITCLYVS